MDNSGLHGLSCNKSKGRIARHTAVSAEILSRLDLVKLSHCDNKKPYGVTTMPWSRGHNLAWDWTCPVTLAASHLNASVTVEGVPGHSKSIRDTWPCQWRDDTFLTGRRLEAVIISLAAFECGSAKRKCSVCVRHRTLGGVGHFGLLVTFHYLLINKTAVCR